MYVLYSYDGNSILVRPMKNRENKEFLRVYTELMHYLTIRGLKPTIHRLDNEASKEYKNTMAKNDIKYQ